MSMFWTDSLEFCCADVEAVKRWWIQVFRCRQVKRALSDVPLPSAVALALPDEDDEPQIVLCDAAELRQAGFEPPDEHSILFCGNLEKAREHLSGCGAQPGPVQDGGGTEFFEIRDPEGHIIEICREP